MNDDKLLQDIKSLSLENKLKLNNYLLSCSFNSQVVLSTPSGRRYVLTPKKDVKVK